MAVGSGAIAEKFSENFPAYVIEKAPTRILEGLIPDSAGTGFSSVTVVLACAVTSAALVACTETELGLGSVAGA